MLYGTLPASRYGPPAAARQSSRQRVRHRRPPRRGAPHNDRVQVRREVAVDLDGDDPPGAFDKEVGEGPASGPDLDDGVGRRRRQRVGDALERLAVGEEVLPEAATRWRERTGRIAGGHRAPASAARDDDRQVVAPRHVPHVLAEHLLDARPAARAAIRGGTAARGSSDAVLAEPLVEPIAGVAHAVGEQEQQSALCAHARSVVTRRAVAHAQRRDRRVEALHAAVPGDHECVRVAGIGKPQPSACGVDDAVEHASGTSRSTPAPRAARPAAPSASRRDRRWSAHGSTRRSSSRAMIRAAR